MEEHKYVTVVMWCQPDERDGIAHFHPMETECRTFDDEEEAKAFAQHAHEQGYDVIARRVWHNVSDEVRGPKTPDQTDELDEYPDLMAENWKQIGDLL